MKKILITGAYSLLGSGLLNTIPSQKYQIFPCFHNHAFKSLKQKNIIPIPLDIINQKNTTEIFSKIKPDIVIHAAALSDVDYCEKNKKETRQVNIQGLKNILNNCKIYNSKIIFISSNAVFSGNETPPGGYSENDQPDPINYYGLTKFEGEQLVRHSGITFLIFRLITMYGWEPSGARQNPVTWKLIQFKKEQILPMVTERFINPLYNINAAHAIWSAITQNRTGLFHIAGADKVSRYQWALEVASIFGYPESLIKPVKSNFFPSLTARPANTCFNTDKMKKELGIKPISLKLGLELMKNASINTI